MQDGASVHDSGGTTPYAQAARTAANALHQTLSATNQSIPGACRAHLQEALAALRTMRDARGTPGLHAAILDVEIMLQQKTRVVKMVPKVLEILEVVESG